jgi:hypothetical protein
MGRYGIQSAELSSKKITRIASALGVTTYNPRPDEDNLEVTTVGAYAMAITMPSPAECADQIMTIFFTTDGGQDVTIYNSSGTQIGAPLTAAGDHQVLYSNGYRWFVLLDVHTP